ncbi:MAG: helix-turn-helix domain-containing protein [Desulfobulbaceae bacterium]|nr:helix-turn-helix domain-containing protein [Desulfobulbaceae bacterium]
MSRTYAETESLSLGDYLRTTRTNQGLDLVTVSERTKISAKNLRAIEESDFTALPAEAFTRGFYVLYAKNLSLDSEEVLEMYKQERPKQHESTNDPMSPPSKLAQEVSNMAERPTFMPFSFLGLILLLLLFFGGFLCWYFSWNPATYLSQKLRSLDNPQQVEQITEYRTDPTFRESKTTFAQLKNPWPKHLDLSSFSYPSTATAAIVQEKPKTSSQVPLNIPDTTKGPITLSSPKDLQQ